MLEIYLWWIITGIALVVAELITGTFYLLVIGIAAFAGAAAAFGNYSFWTQAVVAAVFAVTGVILVNRYRRTQASAPGVSLDVGQSVVLDSWINEKDRLARVRYRNSLWDAKVLDDPAVAAGHQLYIRHTDGNTLHVSATRPA